MEKMKTYVIEEYDLVAQIKLFIDECSEEDLLKTASKIFGGNFISTADKIEFTPGEEYNGYLNDIIEEKRITDILDYDSDITCNIDGENLKLVSLNSENEILWEGKISEFLTSVLLEHNITIVKSN